MNEPLGDFAWALLCAIKAERNKLVITNLILTELERYYSSEELNGMFKPFEALIEKIVFTIKQSDEAKLIAKLKKVPINDALHAVIARDNNLVLITRDNHFKELNGVCTHYKPEELI